MSEEMGGGEIGEIERRDSEDGRKAGKKEEIRFVLKMNSMFAGESA